MSELTDRIRKQQERPDKLTPEQIRDALDRHFAAHDDHPWHQVGRCVYCGPCGVRLFQGTFDPAKHEVYTPPPKRDLASEMLRARRERYGQ